MNSARHVLTLVAMCVAIGAAASPALPPAARFEDVTAASGLSAFQHVSGDTLGSGVALWDYDNDGLVDIYLLNGSTPDRVQSGRAAPPAAMFHNRGNGTFENVTAATGLANERWGQGVCVGDIDNDGFEDVYVTNAGSKNRLYRHTRAGRFEDIAEAAGVAVDDRASTGCAFVDFDHDGWLDLSVASADAPGRLFRNEHDRTFTDASHQSPAGASGARDAGVRSEARSGVAIGDFDNDGRVETLDANDADDSLGRVVVAAASSRAARGVAIADLDNDGDLDIVINMLDGPPIVARNTTIGVAAAATATRSHWLTLRLRGDHEFGTPRDAIGTVVTVTLPGGREVRGKVASGRGYLSHSDLRIHFGLGEATSIEKLVVTWPNEVIDVVSDPRLLPRVDAINDFKEIHAARRGVPVAP